MIPGRVLVALISVVLSLNFLLMPIDASTEEMGNAKNKTKDLLTNIFNTLFSETGEKSSNSKYGVNITFPKNWTGIEMNIVPMALVSPGGFNFTEMFATISNATVDTVAESIVSNNTDGLTEEKNQELTESLSNKLMKKFENMTSTMGILIYDKEFVRLADLFNPNSTMPEDSLTSIFENLTLASDPTTVCERNALERITINDNINAEKSTQQCLFTNSELKRDNLNYFILTPNAIVGIIFSSDSNNQNEKYLREFEESLKSLSINESLPINNQSIHHFLNDDMNNNTDTLLNDTAQNILNTFNGNELLSQGKYEEAISLYDSRLSVDPKDVEALNNKGVALHHLGRFEEAISTYDKALVLDPKYVNALFSKGAALDTIGRHEEAISWYDKALSVDPKNVDALNGNGLALSQLGRHEEAISWYDNTLAVDPKNVDALTSKGIELGKLNRTEDALNWFDKALQVDPEYVVALNNKGISLAVLGKYEEALNWFDKALQVDAKDVRALTLKGSVLNDLGKKTEALTWIDKALTIDPNNQMVIDAKSRVQG